MSMIRPHPRVHISYEDGENGTIVSDRVERGHRGSEWPWWQLGVPKDTALNVLHQRIPGTFVVRDCDVDAAR